MQPGRYAEMLADRMSRHQVDCWLINTGWTGGRYGTGKRCPLAVTRRIVDAVHSGELKNAPYETFETFGLQIPTAIEGVPRELLNPGLAWPDRAAFEREVRKLAGMFQKAFALYEKDVEEKVRLAGPQL
jgi:phosphoenolpyruvate carboxykinase (ATP)